MEDAKRENAPDELRRLLVRLYENGWLISQHPQTKAYDIRCWCTATFGPTASEETLASLYNDHLRTKHADDDIAPLPRDLKQRMRVLWKPDASGPGGKS